MRLSASILIRRAQNNGAKGGKQASASANAKWPMEYGGRIQMIIELTERNFENEALQTNMPVLVDFWAPWCRPCQVLEPTVEKLTKDYKGRVKFCKVNVDESREVARKYQVMSIPMLLFFKDGQPVDQIVGAVAESKLRLKLDGLI